MTAVKKEGKEAVLTDMNGDTMTLVYDGRQKEVYEKEE